MQNWGAEKKQGPGRGRGNMQRRTARKPKRDSPAKRPTKSKAIASGGSVKPFLRRLYHHQAVVSGPVQRVILFLILAGLVYAFILGDSGAIHIAVLRNERGRLDRQITELDRNAERLATEIEQLENDPFAIERAGRERFGYARPGEKVYRIVREPEAP